MRPEQVTDRESLARFVEELRADSERWENASLDSYLEALAAWVTDSPGYFAGRGEETPSEPDWAFVATMLAAATGYE